MYTFNYCTERSQIFIICLKQKLVGYRITQNADLDK